MEGDLHFTTTAVAQQHSHHVCVHVGVGVGVPGCVSGNASIRSCIYVRMQVYGVHTYVCACVLIAACVLCVLTVCCR